MLNHTALKTKWQAFTSSITSVLTHGHESWKPIKPQTKPFHMQTRYRCLFSISLTNAEVAQLPLLLFWIILRKHTGILCRTRQAGEHGGGRWLAGTSPRTLGDKAQRGHGAGFWLPQLLRGTWCRTGDLPSPNHARPSKG